MEDAWLLMGQCSKDPHLAFGSDEPLGFWMFSISGWAWPGFTMCEQSRMGDGNLLKIAGT